MKKSVVKLNLQNFLADKFDKWRDRVILRFFYDGTIETIFSFSFTKARSIFCRYFLFLLNLRKKLRKSMQFSKIFKFNLSHFLNMIEKFVKMKWQRNS